MEKLPLLQSRYGLYDPEFERAACGVGIVANISGKKSHDILEKGLEVLVNLAHRGACGCDPLTGDGAGILLQIPHQFLSSGKARQMLDWRPKFEFDEGLRRTIPWYQDLLAGS